MVRSSLAHAGRSRAGVTTRTRTCRATSLAAPAVASCRKRSAGNWANSGCCRRYRHARACPKHPRLEHLPRKTSAWMVDTRSTVVGESVRVRRDIVDPASRRSAPRSGPDPPILRAKSRCPAYRHGGARDSRARSRLRLISAFLLPAPSRSARHAAIASAQPCSTRASVGAARARRRQVGVARRHGEAVRLAHGRPPTTSSGRSRSLWPSA